MYGPIQKKFTKKEKRKNPCPVVASYTHTHTPAWKTQQTQTITANIFDIM